MSQLYQLKSATTFSTAIFGRPVYLVSISRSGRTTRWCGSPAGGSTFTRDALDKLRARFPTQLRGRIVRFP